MKHIIRKHLNEVYQTKQLFEGFDDQDNPDLKYYAFDWDDNILEMPTKIIVLDEDGKEVGMSTEDFAEYRTMIGVEEFDYKGHKIVGFSETPFKNFRVEGDKQFVVDSMLAKPGPSWNDFVECINAGSIFAIITARGHTPTVLRESIYNFIQTNHMGINKEVLVYNLKKYRDLVGEKIKDDNKLINDYLDLCKYYPVSFGTNAEANPEEAKKEALKEFIAYVKEMSSKLGKKAFLKNDISNNFIPSIGFSDDDVRNIEKIKDFLEKEYEDNPVRTYLTSKGEKKEV